MLLARRSTPSCIARVDGASGILAVDFAHDIGQKENTMASKLAALLLVALVIYAAYNVAPLVGTFTQLFGN